MNECSCPSISNAALRCVHTHTPGEGSTIHPALLLPSLLHKPPSQPSLPAINPRFVRHTLLESKHFVTGTPSQGQLWLEPEEAGAALGGVTLGSPPSPPLHSLPLTSATCSPNCLTPPLFDKPTHSGESHRVTKTSVPAQLWVGRASL